MIMSGFDSGMSGLVKWPGLIFSLIVATIIALGLGAGAVWWISQNYQFHIPVAAHSTNITLDKKVTAALHLSEPLTLQHTDLDASIDVSGTLSVPVQEQIETIVSVDDTAPVTLQLVYKGDVPVNTELQLTGQAIKATFADKEIELSLTGKLALSGSLPLNIDKAVNVNAAMSLQSPVALIVDQQLSVPVASSLQTRIPVKKALTASDPKILDATLQFVEDRVPVNVGEYTITAPITVQTLK